MTNVFQTNVFQNNVFQQDKAPATVGFQAKFPFYYGAGLTPISGDVIATVNYSLHPVNAIMADNQPVSEKKQVPSDYFGGFPKVTVDKGTVRSKLQPISPANLPRKFTK